MQIIAYAHALLEFIMSPTYDFLNRLLRTLDDLALRRRLDQRMLRNVLKNIPRSLVNLENQVSLAPLIKAHS